MIACQKCVTCGRMMCLDCLVYPMSSQCGTDYDNSYCPNCDEMNTFDENTETDLPECPNCKRKNDDE